MEETIYKDDFYKVAANAAKKATGALQKLISSETRLVIVDVERFEKPGETDIQYLADRCLDYYKEDKVIVAAQIKIYQDDGGEHNAGKMIMFMDKEDMHTLGSLMLNNLATEEERAASGMEESSITEALNIIGNAYLDVVAEVYKYTIMSMVPEIIDSVSFDAFIGEMTLESEGRLYIMFDTNLIVTEKSIKIPFILAVTLKSPTDHKSDE